ncbi:hypothetical protein C8R45DRAFT_947590 [Mycena sanguinolenta]|nr:hypothetical protein C8R45DRAFT_947590 [Mycena sanguinolenta]
MCCHDHHNEAEDDDNTAELISQYGVEGANAGELLGYDSEEENEEDAQSGDKEESGVNTSDKVAVHDAFKKQTHVKAIQQAEGNHRAGGLKTQQAMVKKWKLMARARSMMESLISIHFFYILATYYARAQTYSSEPLQFPLDTGWKYPTHV